MDWRQMKVRIGASKNLENAAIELGLLVGLRIVVGGEGVGELAERQLCGGQLLKQPQQLRLCAFYGPVDVGTFDVDLGRVVLALEFGAPEQLAPVFIVHDLAEDVLHVFALQRQLASQVLFIGVV